MKKLLQILFIAIFAGGILLTACSKRDSRLPVITLKGGTTLYTKLGLPFHDPGATANDDKDGDLTTYIAVAGTVDTTIAGSYKLVYSVSDLTGNPTYLNRTVIVYRGTSNYICTMYYVDSKICNSTALPIFTSRIDTVSGNPAKVLIKTFGGINGLDIQADVASPSNGADSSAISFAWNGNLPSTGDLYDIQGTGTLNTHASVLVIQYQWSNQTNGLYGCINDTYSK